MAQTRTVNGKTQWYWNGNWHTVPDPGGQTAPAASGGVAPPPAQPAPAPSTTPGAYLGQPLPYDPSVANQILLANKNFADTNASIDTAEGTLYSQYGLDSTMPGGRAVAQDPYSRLNLLKQAFESRRRASTTSLGARGQLYSGALNNAQGYNQQFYDQSYDGLRKAQTAAYNKLEEQRRAAAFNHDSGILNLGDSAVQNGLNNRPQPNVAAPAPPAPRAPRPRAATRRATGGRRGPRVLATGGRY